MPTDHPGAEAAEQAAAMLTAVGMPRMPARVMMALAGSPDDGYTAAELAERLGVSAAAVSHVAATSRPANLLQTSFFNDWTDEHVAGYQPRTSNGLGTAPKGPGLGIEIDRSMVGDPVATFS